MVAEQRRPAVRRPVETSPSDADLMEGFGVGNASGGLDMTGFDVEQLLEATGAAEEPPPPPNPIGGRPAGKTIAASRALKKNDTALFDSATRAWKAKVEEVPNAGNARRGLLQKVIDEKSTKYKDANPGMDLEKLKKAAVSNYASSGASCTLSGTASTARPAAPIPPSPT